MAETTATTEALGAAHPAEPTLLGMEAETWVYISIAIFLVLAVFVGKLPQRIAQALDERIAGVKRQLEEAKQLRAEAEALLNGAKASQAAAARDAEAIIARAKTEAQQLVADAEAAATQTIARRSAAAEAKIGASERAAEADLRAEVARQVTAAAAALIAAKADAKVQTKLADDAIAGIDRRLH
jgi:F-type H+-transporting ATPase subunit b